MVFTLYLYWKNIGGMMLNFGERKRRVKNRKQKFRGDIKGAFNRAFKDYREKDRARRVKDEIFSPLCSTGGTSPYYGNKVPPSVWKKYPSEDKINRMSRRKVEMYWNMLIHDLVKYGMLKVAGI